MTHIHHSILKNLRLILRFGGVLLALWLTGAQTAGVVFAAPASTPGSSASLPSDELTAINEYPNWVDHILTCSGAAGQGGAVTLSGADNEAKLWNYFKGQGLSDAQVAGILGNIEQESGFDPRIVQGGGDSNDPAAAGGGGYGIVQWTPGVKIISEAKTYNVTGAVYDLATQVAIVWGEMTHTSPTGVQNMVANLRKINDPAQAASYFVSNFEGGTDPGGIRETFAKAIYAKFSGTGNTGSSGTVNGGCSVGSGSPTCLNATGTIKILCEAKQFDPASYSESAMGDHEPGGNKQWISQVCPAAGKLGTGGKITPSCYLDCSGLVNISVYLAFGYDLNENTNGEAADTANWQHIPFSKLQPGDLVQPAAEAGGHVEIIDHVQGQTLYTFGAHTDQVPQPDQVSPAQFQAAGGDLYLHWIGKT